MPELFRLVGALKLEQAVFKCTKNHFGERLFARGARSQKALSTEIVLFVYFVFSFRFRYSANGPMTACLLGKNGSDGWRWGGAENPKLARPS